MEREQWISILSVPLRRIRPHFWTFSATATSHLAFNIYAHSTACPRLPWRELPAAIVADTIPATLFWLVFSPIMVEVIYMVFAAIFLNQKREESRRQGVEEGIEQGIEKGKEEGREEGREEGETRADTAWREWYNRHQAALAKGEPFTEPPPDFSNGHRNGTG